MVCVTRSASELRSAHGRDRRRAATEDPVRDTHYFGTPTTEPGTARDIVNEMVDAGLLDDQLDRVDQDGLALTGIPTGSAC
jgi:hypothetical protein